MTSYLGDRLRPEEPELLGLPVMLLEEAVLVHLEAAVLEDMGGQRTLQVHGANLHRPYGQQAGLVDCISCIELLIH